MNVLRAHHQQLKYIYQSISTKRLLRISRRFFSSEELLIQQIANKCIPGALLSENQFFEPERKTLANVTDGKFKTFRFYRRLQKIEGLVNEEYFLSFKPVKPKFTHPFWTQSDIVRQMIDKDTGQVCYGLAFRNGIPKVWLAPYGNQLEFLRTLEADKYDPFIDYSYIPGTPHFIGFFPHSYEHQIYSYLDKEKHVDQLDLRLHNLNPDYYGFSLTYDRNWAIKKENHYAIRVPFENFINKELFQLPNVPYLNISYRKMDYDRVSESVVSYLLFSDTT